MGGSQARVGRFCTSGPILKSFFCSSTEGKQYTTTTSAPPPPPCHAKTTDHSLTTQSDPQTDLELLKTASVQCKPASIQKVFFSFPFSSSPHPSSQKEKKKKAGLGRPLRLPDLALASSGFVPDLTQVVPVSPWEDGTNRRGGNGDGEAGVVGYGSGQASSSRRTRALPVSEAGTAAGETKGPLRSRSSSAGVHRRAVFRGPSCAHPPRTGAD